MRGFFLFLALSFLWSMLLTSCTATWSGEGWPVFGIDGNQAADWINKKVNKPDFTITNDK